MNSTSFFMRYPSGSIADLVPRASSFHESKYRKSLEEIPSPGVDEHCHQRLLGVATLGIRAGHSKDEIVEDIKAAIPLGKREVGIQEISAAVDRAMLDTVPAGCNQSAPPSVEIVRRKRLSEAEASKVRKEILSYSTGRVNLDSDDFRNAHGFQLDQLPIASLYPDAFTMIQLLRELYGPNDLLWFGSMNSVGIGSIRPAPEWAEFFETKMMEIVERIGNDGLDSSQPSAFLIDLGQRYSHMVPNALTGRFGKTKSGGVSLRCDDSVCGFRYAILDFDAGGTDEQENILHCLCEALDLRICAVVHTGGRGYHALVKIDGVDSLDEWTKHVRDTLFPVFEALGADPACSNVSRAFRVPGIYRASTASWQKLIITSKNGVKV